MRYLTLFSYIHFTCLGHRIIQLGVRGVVSPLMGFFWRAFGYFTLFGLKQGVFKDFKMVFNYIILANFNKTDSVHVFFIIRNLRDGLSLDVSYFFYCFKTIDLLSFDQNLSLRFLRLVSFIIKKTCNMHTKKIKTLRVVPRGGGGADRNTPYAKFSSLNPIYAGVGLMCPDRYKMWCELFKNYRMTLKFLDFYFFSIRNMFPVSFCFLLCVLVPNHALFWVILTKKKF